jgi:hypothetical protein
MHKLLLVLPLLACATFRPALTQVTTPCQTDATARRVVFDAVVEIATKSGAAADSRRVVFNLPHVSLSEVAIVTDDSVCSAVSDARLAQRPSMDTRELRPVALVRVGSTRYVLWEGQVGAGRFILHVVDSSYQNLLDFVH